jgi:uncharacterized membrane protein YoaK (UPF0700 family)
MLLMLTWAAGSVDAISYLGLGHIFTAMMTGNTVLLGLALGQGEVQAALRSILALTGFAVGAAAGTMIVERDKKQGEWPPAVTEALALEGMMLAILTMIWHLTGTDRSANVAHILIVLSGLAMGIQAAAVRRLGVPGIATTYITGTLTSLVVDLVGWIRSATAQSVTTAAGKTVVDGFSAVQWEHRVGLLAGVFFVYGLGALVGGVLQSKASPLVTLLPLVAVAFVVMNASIRHWHEQHTSG